ncbi:OmpA family protein [Pedobacter insulae]|uniref:OmpA-OmpF porin, OOP family n=1 Tax=Pedobacter insulae TaxID=414048 RepID=A0A1I2WZ44_9SPHI|nr:OmpA family protein [Pedobacter insulae]SFH05706.1 OmpA-OmpF porin, OOP family [Pedobacter insulae]
MNLTRKILFVSLIGLSTVLYSCKAKKPIVKTPAPVSKPAAVEEKKAPEPEKKEEEKPMPVEKLNSNLAKVQFEFNSFVLKTASLPILDMAVTEMKKFPDTKFILNGHSSAEGSESHNLSLSVDRANAVKSYFVNAGLNAANFKIVGHGDKMPIASNSTEAGRILNRRTEVQVAN